MAGGIFFLLFQALDREEGGKLDVSTGWKAERSIILVKHDLHLSASQLIRICPEKQEVPARSEKRGSMRHADSCRSAFSSTFILLSLFISLLLCFLQGRGWWWWHALFVVLHSFAAC